jgi:tetratricopeptide (TPR) repeat protein
MDDAVAVLDEVIQSGTRVSEATAKPRPAQGWRELLARQPAADTLDVDADSVVMEARKLRALLVQNRDPHQNDLALRRLLRLDPEHQLYSWNLRRLLDEVEAGRLLTRLGDNLTLLLALNEASASLKIERLKEVYERFSRDPASDVPAQALYELAVSYQRDNRTEEARQAFDRLIREHADSPWALEAKGRVANMGVAARAGEL